MTSADALQRGRDAFDKRAWTEACELLTAADQSSPLGAEDLNRLAAAAFLIGRDETCENAWTRAFHEFQARGDLPSALRAGYFLAFSLIQRAEFAPAMGWFARGQRLLEESKIDCVERAYLMIPMAIQMIDQDPSGARDIFAQAIEIGERFSEVDITTLARVGFGRSLIKMGEAPRGIAFMDEAMIAATADELSPIMTGNVYCVVIEGCFEISDLPRARGWTEALTRWCDTQPDLVPYRGECLVHRTEIMQMVGTWPEAITNARAAIDRLAKHPMLGEAYYLHAQLNRLRGEFDEAEDRYRKANEWGREPQPGMALLRLAQGHLDAALASIRRAVDEKTDPLARSRLLATYVEILLAAGEVPNARSAADELAELTKNIDSPVLHAASSHASGSVLLAEDQPKPALETLRNAWAQWSRLEVPYEAARVRLRIGLACRLLGDADTADLEIAAARAAFEQLGATPDLAALDALSQPASTVGGLSPREVEVLRLIAKGKTNRAVAADLVLSEKTVARHVANIFTKLGISSRSAATAFAYEHDLV